MVLRSRWTLNFREKARLPMSCDGKRLWDPSDHRRYRKQRIFAAANGGVEYPCGLNDRYC
jgi:hypothetical protein